MTERELIDSGLAAYRQALEAGMTPDEAKQFAHAEVPEMRPILGQRKFLTRWSNGIKAIKIEFGLAPRGGRPPKTAAAHPVATTNGNGENDRHEEIVRTGSGRVSVTDTYLAILQCRALKPGDELCIGDLEWWSAALGVTSSALAMPFRRYDHRPPSAFTRAGWRFEIVNPSFRCFTVRVAEAPAPPPPPATAPATPAEKTYTAAEVQALFAEFLATRRG